MRKTTVIFFFLLCAIGALVAGCSSGDSNVYDSPNYHPPGLDDDAADDDTDGGPSSGDDDGNETGDLPQWLLDRPYLQNRSLWAQEIDMADPEWVRNLGCMGVGNGKVFGILGDQYPSGTWHNLGGPNYEMDLKWFSDKEPWLIAHNHYVKPTRQSIARVRRSPVVVASHTDEVLEWTSVNFAPIGATDELAEHALVSVWIVRNVSPYPIDNIFLEIDSNFGRYMNTYFSEQNYEGRRLYIRPIGVEPTAGDAFNDMWIPYGTIAAGEEKVVVLPYVFTEDDEDPTAVFEAVREEGVDALLQKTVVWWDEWYSRMTRFDTPNQKFNDLMNALALAVKVNQAEPGGISQMVQYSHVWNRDTYGPTLFFPYVGFADDMRAALDYHWGAVLNAGNLGNAYPADLDLSELPPQPDWESLGVMGGFTRAEGPSTVVLQYEHLYKATGDLDVIEERWGMLKHALVKQQFVDGCLLHFSGDETFEDLMELAFGEFPMPDPDESVLSLYSSLLMIKAARFMASMAEELGYEDDEDLFVDLADAVEQCAEDTYWLPDRGFYAVKADTATREPYERPYEDISTMPLWLDALPRDSERVVANFENVMELIGRDNGTLVTDLAWIVQKLLPLYGPAIQTGMSHGYWLVNLDKMFHPMADEAFERWQDVPSPAGFTEEGVTVTDYGHLQLIRDPFGIVCNTSARFRSWESGIMGHAFMFHLTGFDRSVPGSWVKLAPHLPKRWNEFAVRGLSFGDGRIDLEVYRYGRQGRRLVITTDGDASFDLSLTVPLDGEVTGVKANGVPIPEANYDASVNDYGRTVVEIDAFEVAPDTEVAIIVETVE
ncbi:MAG: hypothetical protein P9L99_10515 [Candidatus Lernaella stagnicola]|nr:hypothetical protein [Candidatus Lernaella stagnicola]